MFVFDSIINTGPPGLRGPQGFTGPPGRDGFSERPTSFHAEIQYFDITKHFDNKIRPWIVSDSFNVPTVSNHFSEYTGIFTVSTKGLYQYFLTISISGIKVKKRNHFLIHN